MLIKRTHAVRCAAKFSRHARSRASLALEVLEDRTMPSTLTVGSVADPSLQGGQPAAGTLRWAVQQADKDAAHGISDTIVLNSSTLGGSTIALDVADNGPLVLTGTPGTITLKGDGHVTIKGGSNAWSDGGVFVNSGHAVFSGLTITGGQAMQGGGIDNTGYLTVDNCTITGNSATDGGGIFNSCALVIDNSTFSGNSATYGGGIDTSGAKYVGCTAVYANVIVNNSTFSGNSASLGGGVYNDLHETATLTNCTVAKNDAPTGAGIDNVGAMSLASCTVAQNTAFSAGGGIANGGTLTLRGNIVADNFLTDSTYSSLTSYAPDISGHVNPASSFNLVGSQAGLSGITDGVNGNIIGGLALQNNIPVSYNPDLAPLGNYGGPTQTIALQDGSQAIGHGGSVHPVTDQRGVTRNAVTDIGAFQTQTVASVTVTAPAHATAGSAFLVTVTARDKNGSVVVGYTGTVTVSFTSSDGQQVYLSSAAVTLTHGVGSVMVTLDLAHTVILTAHVMSHGSDNMTLWPAANPKTSVIVTGVSAGLTVSAATVASFAVSAPGQVTAGTPFALTITAKDHYGNTVPGYSGPVTLTSSDGQQVILAPAGIHLIDGTAIVPVTLDKADALKLTASAGSLKGASSSITVNPATAAAFVVSAPDTATAGTPFSVTITAKDRFGNIAKTFAGSLILLSSDGQKVHVTLPSAAFVNGVDTVNVTLDSAADVTLTAYYGAVKGTSGHIVVQS